MSSSRKESFVHGGVEYTKSELREIINTDKLEDITVPKLKAVTKYYKVNTKGSAIKKDYVKALKTFKAKKAATLQKAYRTIKPKVVKRHSAAKKIQTVARGQNVRSKQILQALKRPVIRVSPQKTPPQAVYVPQLDGEEARIAFAYRTWNDITKSADMRGGIRDFNPDTRRNYAMLRESQPAEYTSATMPSDIVKPSSIMSQKGVYLEWINVLHEFAMNQVMNPSQALSWLNLRSFARNLDSVLEDRRFPNIKLSVLLFHVLLDDVQLMLNKGTEIVKNGVLKHMDSSSLEEASGFLMLLEGYGISKEIVKHSKLALDIGLSDAQLLYNIQLYLKFESYDKKIQEVSYFGKRNTKGKPKPKTKPKRNTMAKTKSKRV